MTDADALASIAALQTWAREKFGEREFKYYRKHYRWHQSYTASGRPRNDGGYRNLGDPTEINKDEYEANHEEGKRQELRAFYDKRKGGYFDTYEMKQVRDGWQDALQRLVVTEDESQRVERLERNQ